MENQKRDMGPDSRGKKEIERGPQEKESLTVMIFREVGKVRRFRISSRLLFCASLFFLLYIVATVYFTNKYFDARRANKVQADKIATLSHKLMETTKDLERSRQHIALLDDYLSENTNQGPEPESPVDYTESPSPKIVDIEGLKIRRDGSTIDIYFRIVNMLSNDEPIGGYIFVLASEEDSDQSEAWVYPSSPLKDGFPVNYRAGQRFLIQRFKTVSSKYTLGKPTTKPLFLKILVYDRNGTLILKKVVEV
jgi:uncharacterized coiled-coil protein SlyX